MGYRLSRILEIAIFVAASAFLLTWSAPRAVSEGDRVAAFTRGIEFDYVSWIVNAATLKIQQGSVGIPGYLDRATSRVIVSDYLQVTQQEMLAEDAINRIYADASIQDKTAASAHVKSELRGLQDRQNQLAPLAEGVLQAQVSQVAADDGLTTLGQPIPAVLFRTTSVPDALIVSPRNHIQEDENISIEPGLPVEEQARLENNVESGLDVSALVVPVGGVGVYPTMIMRTTDLSWLASTIAHEWTHNYLTLRPLGVLYDQTPELRTMNETTADIVGSEIGNEVMRRYYGRAQQAALTDGNLADFTLVLPKPVQIQAPPFDFRAEMHATRVAVDAMLASGKIAEAESYMEQRRQVFVQNGYFIRRLNQAYFAFYGAYADVPGGAAGEDPVGPAVRLLRSQSPSLAAFVNRIAWMTSFQQLQNAVAN
jgi:hypothetical protein